MRPQITEKYIKIRCVVTYYLQCSRCIGAGRFNNTVKFEKSGDGSNYCGRRFAEKL